MGILLSEQNFRNVWIGNESVGPTGRNLSTFAHTHTHAAKLVVRMTLSLTVIQWRSLGGARGANAPPPRNFRSSVFPQNADKYRPSYPRIKKLKSM